MPGLGNYDQTLADIVDMIKGYADQALSIRWNTLLEGSMDEILAPLTGTIAVGGDAAYGNPLLASFLGTMLPQINMLQRHYEDNYFNPQNIIDIDGLINAVKQFKNAVMRPSYRQYFNMFEMGFFGDPNTSYGQGEFLYFVGCRTMEDFYRIAGLGDSGIAAMNSYANGTMNEVTLIRKLYLQNKTQVINVVGAGWCLSADFKRALAEQGINLTIDQSFAFIKEAYASLGDISAADLERINEFVQEYITNGSSVKDLDQRLIEILVGDEANIGNYNKVVNENSETYVIGTTGADILYGSDDTTISEYIFGDAGNDIIIGGKGDDYLDGDAGSDSYLWRIGDGNDTIYDYDYGTDSNRLFFAEGIKTSDIVVSQDGYNAVFTHSPSGESVTVENWFADSGYQLSEVQFVDGGVWSKAQINAFLNDGTALPLSSLSPNLSGSVSALQPVNTTWRKSSVASLIGGSATSQMAVDMAVAGLQFDGNSAGQICDITSYVAGANANPYAVTTSLGSDLKNYFSEESRKSA